MNDQQETTAKTEEPKLCKMGCGFFGSNATGDCCSKCWNELRKKEGSPAVLAAQQPQPPTDATTATPAPLAEAADCPVVESKPAAALSPTKKKKKKKKTSYKNMMAGMIEGSGPRSAEKEKEGIKKVTGGGAFVKIDKI